MAAIPVKAELGSLDATRDNHMTMLRPETPVYTCKLPLLQNSSSSQVSNKMPLWLFSAMS